MYRYILAGLLALTGCSGISPELIEALSKDSASLCFQADGRGGAGTIVSPMGGYGQATLSLCRSNFPNAKLSATPEGAISIQHGEDVE